ncbi:hypothetical protein CS369_18910 [Candidatus Symbiopectobacterium sp. 'North America']|nr:hypothetical protein [Candidatus Symbiopectobacterium sp. 'North America']
MTFFDEKMTNSAIGRIYLNKIKKYIFLYKYTFCYAGIPSRLTLQSAARRLSVKMLTFYIAIGRRAHCEYV